MFYRNIKDCSDFLKIEIKKKKLLDLQNFIENKFNKLAITMMTNDNEENYLEVISSFEVQFYKKIFKKVTKNIYFYYLILYNYHEYLNDIFEIIKDSIALKELFDNYSIKLTYAKNVRFEDTIDAIKQIIDILESELVGV